MSNIVSLLLPASTVRTPKDCDVWGFDPAPVAFGFDSTEMLSEDPKCPDAAMVCPRT